MAPEVLVERGEPELEQSLLALDDLGRDDGGGREDVAGAEDKEDQTDARNVPRSVISVNRKKLNFKILTDFFLLNSVIVLCYNHDTIYCFAFLQL